MVKGLAAKEGPTAAMSAAGDPAVVEKGAGGRGRTALAHPRPKSAGSSRLYHLRT